MGQITNLNLQPPKEVMFNPPLLEGADQLRLQGKPLDGKQVEPALEDPVND